MTLFIRKCSFCVAYEFLRPDPFSRTHSSTSEIIYLELLKQAAVLETLRKERFDIIISDMLHLCGAGLKEVLGIKTHVWLNR